MIINLSDIENSVRPRSLVQTPNLVDSRNKLANGYLFSWQYKQISFAFIIWQQLCAMTDLSDSSIIVHPWLLNDHIQLSRNGIIFIVRFHDECILHGTHAWDIQVYAH